MFSYPIPAQETRVEKIRTHTVMTVLPYPLFERIRLLVPAHQGQILDEAFGADITLTARFAVEDFPIFQPLLEQQKPDIRSRSLSCIIKA